MEFSLHYNLLAAHTRFQKVFLNRLAREMPELLPGQPKVIDFLLSHPTSFQREVAEGCLIDPATLSPILRKMELAGVIRRDKAVGNRKNSVVSLTPAGQSIGRRIRELFREVETVACGGVTANDLDTLMQCLAKIQTNCKNELS